MEKTSARDKEEKVAGKYWSPRALLVDFGIAVLVYVLIMVIIFTSRTAPADFAYIAF